MHKFTLLCFKYLSSNMFRKNHKSLHLLSLTAARYELDEKGHEFVTNILRSACKCVGTSLPPNKKKVVLWVCSLLSLVEMAAGTRKSAATTSTFYPVTADAGALEAKRHGGCSRILAHPQRPTLLYFGTKTALPFSSGLRTVA